MQNKFYLLSKKLNISSQEIKKLIYKEIKTLNFIPSSKYNYTPSLPLIIDITIKYENARWIITINEDELPLFIIKENYFSFSKEILSSEDKKFIRLNILQGKWILKSLARRKKILIQIASFLVKKQRNYLLGLGNLTPLSYNDLAKELNLHVSTISRAANNKYVDCPLGILPLKAFFSSSLEIPNAVNLLKKLIQEEDKKNPLSDEKLSQKISFIGVPCARRTITKYRKKLKIPSIRHRKI